jgi:nanoRNase/pAp phosphatase (c-di-AMP/oligoRNAs hydrolase)
MDKFLGILNQYKGKRLLVLCHDDADSDALGAAFVMARVLDGDMAVPRTVSEHARELQYKLKMKIVFQPELNNYDLTLIVDTADSQQLPGCMPKQYLLIDHHPENKLVDGAMAAVYDLVDSTCQLVWRVCQARGDTLDEDLTLALGAGIMGDTRYLATAANSTIADLAEILEVGGVTYRDLIRVVRVTSRIEREVRLQAAFSGRLYQIGNCLVASTSAERNYVYYVTMMLLELGADIAVVGYQQQENCFIRIAKNPTTAHCLNLFMVLEEAVQSYPRQNLWGSSEFAGFNGEANVEKVTDDVIAGLERLQSRLGVCQCADTTLVSP